MHSRNTLNSQSAAYNALSLVQESEGIPPRSIPVPLEPSLASTTLFTSSVLYPNTALLDLHSLAFLSTIANAVQQVRSAQQLASLPTVPIRRNITGNDFANGNRTDIERVRQWERNGYRTDSEWIQNGNGTHTKQERIKKMKKKRSLERKLKNVI